MRAEMKFQSYPWYVQDWFVSDARARLTLEERGLYREILDLLYLHEGFLEDDPDILQRKTGCKEKEFSRSWPKVKACFDVSDDGRLCHPKVLETLSKVYKYKTERSESGKIGAETRWKGRAKGSANGSAIGQPLATGWQNDSLPLPLPQPLPLPSSSPAPTSVQQEEINQDAEFLTRWNRWPAKGQTRQPLSQQRWCDVFLPLSPSEARAVLAEIDAGLDRWLNSKQFAKGFVFAFADFVAQRRWNEQPEQTEPAADEQYSNQEVEDHWQEMQRLMKQGIKTHEADQQAREMIAERRRHAAAS